MLHLLHHFRVVPALALLAFAMSSHAKNNIKLDDYATNGLISTEALVELVIDYYDIPYVELRPKVAKPSYPRDKMLAPTAASKADHPKVFVVQQRLFNRSRGTGGPYKVDEVKKALDQPDSALAQYDAQPGIMKLTGITQPYARQTTYYAGKDGTGEYPRTVSGSPGDIMRQTEQLKSDPEINVNDAPRLSSKASLGPFQLRRSVASTLDYNVEAFKWKPWLGTNSSMIKPEDLASIQGAKIGYSDNRLLDGGGAWSSEGALIYPFHYVSLSQEREDRFFHAGLATSWKLEEQEKAGTSDIDELKFSAPAGLGLHFNETLFFIQAEPYFHTDTDFDSGIVGATASFEFKMLHGLGSYFPVGKFGSNTLYARFRAVGLVDYSDVQDTSPYIKRSLNDDWFRVGAVASFDMGLYPPNAKQPPITIGASYRFMQEVGDDNGGYSDLFKANATMWLSPNAGLTLEYQKGETPVADKDIDIITLGLELKL